MSEPDQRFGGIARLYGVEGLARLRAAHVCVMGIGGVGSWAVEALARSGVGNLTLVDLDDVCLTNINRQLHALDGTIGLSKAAVMAERVRGINPSARVNVQMEFFTETSAAAIFAGGFDYVVDAIDAVANKCRLIVVCRDRGIPVVSCGAAGGRLDATAVRVADLADVSHDRLLLAVRKRLRQDHGFPPGGYQSGVTCVFSPETPVMPASTCEADTAEVNARLNCDWGYGSATFVTGTFGFAAAGFVVSKLAGAPNPPG